MEFDLELRHIARLSNPTAGLALIIFLICSWAVAQESVASILQKSVEANDRDWKAAPQYDYFERDRDPQGTKTYSVTNVLGSPYEKLVAINDKELEGSKKSEEQRKFEQMESKRRAESPQQRAKRISSYEADRRRDHEMLEQLTKAFDFTLQGEQKIGEHKVYVLDATPHAGYHPPNRNMQVLLGMQGKLWIDQATFQWVKVEAQVVHPVTIQGFLAQVEPGTRFELEKMPVENDTWLAKHFAMTASAKVLFLVPHHSREDETYFNYHKSQNSSGKTPLDSSEKRQYADSRPANH